MWYESIPSCEMIFWILALNSTGKIHAWETDYKTERIFSFECFIPEISKFLKNSCLCMNSYKCGINSSNIGTYSYSISLSLHLSPFNLQQTLTPNFRVWKKLTSNQSCKGGCIDNWSGQKGKRWSWWLSLRRYLNISIFLIAKCCVGLNV